MFKRVTPEAAGLGSRRNTRRWLAVTTVAAAGLLAAACGSNTPSKSSTQTTVKHHSSATTTTTTTAASSTTTTAAGATTTTAAGATTTTAKTTTATTTKTTTATTVAGASNALGGSNDFNVPSASLTGAGSTFDQPLFARQFYDFNNDTSKKVSVNYASVGSGTGESDILAGSVNFGASDVPEPAGTTGTGGAILQIPVILGGIAMAYNEPCLGTNTHLTGTQIAQIYAGKTTDWHSIDASCPSGSNIVPVHRADSSGTQNAFTHYLTAVDAGDWAASCAGKTSSCYVGGLAGNGNPGVAGDVSGTPGAIGFVELAYALQSGLNYAAVQNAAGAFVVPTLSSVAADAAQFPGVSPTNYLIVNGGGSGSYPISTYSWVIVFQKQSNTNNGLALGKMLDWMATTGQADASAIGYVPLPANIQTLARNTIMQMENSSGQALF